MNNNLSKSLMTSHLALVSGFLIGLSIVPLAAYADPANDIREHINRGNMLLGRRLFQDAINEYEEVLKIETNNSVAKNNIALAHNDWGIFYYNQRKYPEAKEQWETALKLNPNDGNVRRNLKILEIHIRNNPPPKPAAPPPDAPPKPTGPQDWNPYEESLGKIPKKPSSDSSSASAPPTAEPKAPTIPGQQQAQAEPVPEGPPSGPVIILSTGTSASTTGGTNQSSTTSDSPFGSANVAAPATHETGTTSQPASSVVRIVGGSTGNASIVVGGSPAISNPTPPPSGTTYSAGSANVFASPGASRPTPTASNTPVRIPQKPAGGSVPMSWPGADNTPSVKTAPNTPPSFLDKQDDTPQEDNAEQADSSLNVEDTLAKIENKVYGKVSKNMPIIKRVEKLEVDTMGKKQSGSIADRLKELKNTYGI